MSYGLKNLDYKLLKPHDTGQSHENLFSIDPVAAKSPRATAAAKITPSWITTLELVNATTMSTMNVNPDGNKTRSLGSTTNRWKDIYSNTLNAEASVTTNVILVNYIRPNGNAQTFVQNLYPENNNTRSLGAASNLWNNTYTTNLTVTNLYAISSSRINSFGHFYPGAHNTYDLGASSLYWRNLYANYAYTTSLKAQYADLAEKYSCKEELSVGDVVVISKEKGYDIEICNEFASNKILGVVTENPAILMNELCVNGIPIARLGKIRCKVIGKAKKGDTLISSINGAAIVTDEYVNSCMIVGFANENKNYIEEGLIEIIR